MNALTALNKITGPLPLHTADEPIISRRSNTSSSKATAMAEATTMRDDLQVHMEGEPFIVSPAEERPRRVQFLSNMDQMLLAPAATITFFGPCAMAFAEIQAGYTATMQQLLLHYDFIAGRLRASGNSGRLEIDCAGQGVLLAWAHSPLALADLGDITVPNPAFRQLTLVHRLGLSAGHDGPLFTLQVTRFSCESFAVGVALNHCILDGVGSHDFTVNLAAITRGQPVPVTPFTDRTLLAPRSPPQVEHQHLEFMKLPDRAPLASDSTAFGAAGGRVVAAAAPASPAPLRLFPMPAPMLEALKAAAAAGGRLARVTSFEAATAHLWRTRFLSMGLPDDAVTTVLFPVDVRRRVTPPLPREYAGNAVIPGYARATVAELREAELSVLVERVQQGLKRLDDGYVRSAIDWLELHRGVPCLVNSFSVVTWMRLELAAGSYPWGLPLHLAPVILHGMDLMFLLPPKDPKAGGFNATVMLQPPHMDNFRRLFPFPPPPTVAAVGDAEPVIASQQPQQPPLVA